METRLPKGKIGKSIAHLFATKEKTHDISKNMSSFLRYSQKMEGKITATVHKAAAEGDLEALKALEKENSDSLFKVDENGWTALQ